MILDDGSFAALLERNVFIFCGNGSKKWQHLCRHSNAIFVDVNQNVADLAQIAARKLKDQDFSDLAYTEPAYLKNAYTGISK
jgi:tRNA threonylcarbamoyladenosine biosynthesis protein TsaB